MLLLISTSDEHVLIDVAIVFAKRITVNVTDVLIRDVCSHNDVSTARTYVDPKTLHVVLL
jgi:hypothetical protein